MIASESGNDRMERRQLHLAKELYKQSEIIKAAYAYKELCHITLEQNEHSFVCLFSELDPRIQNTGNQVVMEFENYLIWLSNKGETE